MEKINKNKPKFVIYARKSSEGEERQAKSIEDQINTMKEIAKRDNLDILQIYQESKSAKEPGRPVFNEMIKNFEKGKFNSILCWKIDRLARNPKDEGTIKWMLQNGAIRIIKTFERDYLPDDNSLIASVEFGMATQYVKDLSKNVIRGLTEKVKRGEYPGCPLAGYQTDHKTRKLILDAGRSSYIETAFRLYATGKYPIKDLADKLYTDGLRSNSGKKVYHSAIYNILKNPLYYGYFKWKGQIHKGVHEAIVSKNIFDEVQRTIELRKRSKCGSRNKKNFTFHGFMHCACGLRMTAEAKTKKNKENIHHYVYYRCTKSKGAKYCSQKYLREEELTEEIYKNLSHLYFDKKMLDLIISATKERSQNQWERQYEIEEKNAFLLERNKTRQNSLVEKYIDNKIPEDIYEHTLTELRNEQALLENKIENVQNNSRDVFSIIESLMTFLKLAGRIFQDGDNETKKEALSIISSNLVIKDKKISDFSLKEPFNFLYKDLQNFKMPNDKNKTLEPVEITSNKRKTEAPASAISDLWAIQESNLRPRHYQ